MIDQLGLGNPLVGRPSRQLLHNLDGYDHTCLAAARTCSHRKAPFTRLVVGGQDHLFGGRSTSVSVPTGPESSQKNSTPVGITRSSASVP